MHDRLKKETRKQVNKKEKKWIPESKDELNKKDSPHQRDLVVIHA